MDHDHLNAKFARHMIRQYGADYVLRHTFGSLRETVVSEIRRKNPDFIDHSPERHVAYAGRGEVAA